jgi:hypothetical protein
MATADTELVAMQADAKVLKGRIERDRRELRRRMQAIRDFAHAHHIAIEETRTEATGHGPREDPTS